MAFVPSIFQVDVAEWQVLQTEDLSSHSRVGSNPAVDIFVRSPQGAVRWHNRTHGAPRPCPHTIVKGRARVNRGDREVDIFWGVDIFVWGTAML